MEKSPSESSILVVVHITSAMGKPRSLLLSSLSAHLLAGKYLSVFLIILQLALRPEVQIGKWIQWNVGLPHILVS